MSLVWKERLKFSILLFLIAMSLLQVGILWNYQNYGFPTGLFSIFHLDNAKKNSSEDYKKIIRDKYFIPDKIIISEGYDNPRWIVEQQSGDYNKLWKEAQYYMKSAMLSEPVQSLSDSDWGSLIASRSFVFEFRTNIKKDLLAWFLDMPGVSSDSPSGVYKMIILPEEDLNYNINTVYIRDDSHIYKYTIPYSGQLMNRNDYEDIFRQFENNKDTIQYAVLREKYNIQLIGQDILGVMKGQGYRSYSTVTCTQLEEFKTEEIYDSSDVDKIAEVILGSEKYGYDRSWNSENTIEFKTMNNIFRIYNDGFLEYNFLSGTANSDKGSISDAFMQAALFLEKLEAIPHKSNVRIFLSEIEESATYYKFYFDYAIAGVPVVVDYGTRGQDKVDMKNAFVIEANGRNVLKGYGVVKKFDKGNESNLYDIMFIDLINDAYEVYGYSEFGNVAGITINGISIAYKVEYSTDNQELKPVWTVETPDRMYTIPMRKK